MASASVPEVKHIVLPLTSEMPNNANNHRANFFEPMALRRE